MGMAYVLPKEFYINIVCTIGATFMEILTLLSDLSPREVLILSLTCVATWEGFQHSS